MLASGQSPVEHCERGTIDRLSKTTKVRVFSYECRGRARFHARLLWWEAGSSVKYNTLFILMI